MNEARVIIIIIIIILFVNIFFFIRHIFKQFHTSSVSWFVSRSSNLFLRACIVSVHYNHSKRFRVFIQYLWEKNKKTAVKLFFIIFTQYDLSSTCTIIILYLLKYLCKRICRHACTVLVGWTSSIETNPKIKSIVILCKR